MCCFRFLLHILQENGIVVSNSFSFGMICTQHSLAGRQCPLVERLSLLVLALGMVEDCQVIDGAQSIGVLGSQHPLAGLQGTLIEWSCLPVLALPIVEFCEVIEP